MSTKSEKKRRKLADRARERQYRVVLFSDGVPVTCSKCHKFVLSKSITETHWSCNSCGAFEIEGADQFSRLYCDELERQASSCDISHRDAQIAAEARARALEHEVARAMLRLYGNDMPTAKRAYQLLSDAMGEATLKGHEIPILHASDQLGTQKSNSPMCICGHRAEDHSEDTFGHRHVCRIAKDMYSTVPGRCSCDGFHAVGEEVPEP